MSEEGSVLTFHIVVNSLGPRLIAEHLLRHWSRSRAFHRRLQSLKIAGMTVTIIGGGLNVDNRALLGNDGGTLGLNLGGCGTAIDINLCEEVADQRSLPAFC
jgi:hypothetical protein